MDNPGRSVEEQASKSDPAADTRYRTPPLSRRWRLRFSGFPVWSPSALSNWDRITKALQQRSSTSGWHRHDLRRTVATLLGDLGYPPHIISIVLGYANVADGATAVHARSRYQREHKEALQALADAIDRIMSEEHNVVPLAAVS